MRLSWLCRLLYGAWFLILMIGTSMVVTEACQTNEHPVYTTKGRICCPKCEQHVLQDPCEHEMKECRCRQGYGCASKSCTNCNALPECKNGRINTTEVGSTYSYHCEKCPLGTVLDLEAGLCKPSEIPSTTLGSPSTSTLTTEGHIANNSTKETWIFICVSVVFCLLLFTIVIHLLIRTMRNAKPLKRQDLVPPHTNIPISIKEDGDTWSYQYPEEEHGDGALGNKLAAF